jgi:carbamate kinase
MRFSKVLAVGVEQRPLLVIALGGNALSPAAGDTSYAVERARVGHTGVELNALAAEGYRLLIVHGNGPQVGRLMRDDLEGENLDIHVAQTQGELGYLIAATLVEPCATLMTRVVVDPSSPAFADPVKAVGPVLSAMPSDRAARKVGDGWRLLVPSPEPVDVMEVDAARTLLADWHVIAGGGGGVPVTAAGVPCQCVVDKDYVAALFAIALDAQGLVFVTDVVGVHRGFGSDDGHLLRELSLPAARRLLDGAELGAGSMAPKVASAARFVAATGRPAVITGVGTLKEAPAGQTGTVVVRERSGG